MKKLLILSSMITIGIGATNVFNLKNNNNLSSSFNFEKENYNLKEIYSTDYLSYEGANSGKIIFQELPNLLDLFKKINQFHKDNNVEIKLRQIPSWYIKTDANQFLARGWVNDFTNIYYLINSDFVEFKNATIRIINQKFYAFLSYKISDIEQSIELFSFYSANIPDKQRHMSVNFGLVYTY